MTETQDTAVLESDAERLALGVQREQERRAAFIRSLRAMADFLDAQPTVKAPRYVEVNVFVETRDELAAHARIRQWDKIYSETWFYLRKDFGPDLHLDITAPRETVCRRVVTGTRTVEAKPAHEVEEVTWVCDEPSLLAQS